MRPSVASSRALGPNGADFVRIAPSWLARDGGDAQVDKPRARGLPGARPPSSVIKSRSTRPKMYAPEDVVEISDAYGAGGVKLPTLRSPGKSLARPPAARSPGPKSKQPRLGRSTGASRRNQGPGAAPLTPGRADATSDFDATLGTTMTAASSRRPAPPHPPALTATKHTLPGEELITNLRANR